MNYPLQLAFYAVLVFVLFMPWFSPALALLSDHDSSRLALLLLGVFAAFALALTKGRALAAWTPQSTIMRWLLLTSLVLSAASVLTAPSLPWAFKEWMSWLSFFLIALLVQVQVAQAENLKRISQIIAIALLVHSFQCTLSGLMLMATLGELQSSMVAMGYPNIRFLNHMQTVALPLATLVLLPTFNAPVWLKRLAYVGLSFAWALLLLSQGRGTMLGLLVGCLTVVLLFGKRAAHTLRPFVISVVLGGLLFGALFVCVPWLLGFDTQWQGASRVIERGDSGRFYLWQFAWDMFVAHPWLGSGPMQFANISAYKNVPIPNNAHPHNIYVQGLAEWGAPLTVLCLFFGLRLLWLLYRSTVAPADSSSQQPKHERGQILFLTLTAVFVDAIFSGNFVMPVSLVWIALVVGLSGAHIQANTRTNDPRAALIRVHSLMAGMLAAMFIGLAFVLWPELAGQPLGLRHSSTGPLLISPRFWMHGWWH